MILIAPSATVRWNAGPPLTPFIATPSIMYALWRTALTLPPKKERGRKVKRGTWNLTLQDTSGSHEIPFDADGGEAGWNTLGTFELASGDVSLKVSNKTDGKVVLADAVRFRPVSR